MNYQYLEVKKFKSTEVIGGLLWDDIDKIEEGAYPAPVKKLVKKFIVR